MHYCDYGNAHDRIRALNLTRYMLHMTHSVPLGCVPRAWILAIQCHLYRACMHINHGSQPSRVNSQGILRPCLPVSASAGHAAVKDAAPLAHRSERKCWLHVVRLLEGSYRDRLRRHN
jgi:hypothetical protein